VRRLCSPRQLDFGIVAFLLLALGLAVFGPSLSDGPDERFDATYLVVVAVGAVGRVVSLRPDSTEAQASLGRIQSMNRESRESEASLRRAIELNPEYALAYQSLTLVLVTLGESRKGSTPAIDRSISSPTTSSPAATP